MTAQIGKDDAAEIGRLFRTNLEGRVRLVLFTARDGCLYCAQTGKLLEEVASLSDRIELEVLDKDAERGRAEELEVETAPTTVVIASNGARLYFVGMPGGRQLKVLVEDIMDASSGQARLDKQVGAVIGQVRSKTVIKVFVTPFCPYSPQVVRSAHRFSMQNQLIRAEMIETIEFPEIVRRYGIVGVPRTVINEVVGFDGAPTEAAFAEKVLEASKPQTR
jgi:glutaredoxin-like protein